MRFAKIIIFLATGFTGLMAESRHHHEDHNDTARRLYVVTTTERSEPWHYKRKVAHTDNGFVHTPDGPKQIEFTDSEDGTGYSETVIREVVDQYGRVYAYDVQRDVFIQNGNAKVSEEELAEMQAKRQADIEERDLILREVAEGKRVLHDPIWRLLNPPAFVEPAAETKEVPHAHAAGAQRLADAEASPIQAKTIPKEPLTTVVKEPVQADIDFRNALRGIKDL